MQTKNTKTRFFAFTRRKKVKSAISIVLSLLLLNLNLGCSYFTVSPMGVTKENIKTFNELEKYVVVHSGTSVFNLEQMVFNEEEQTISGTAKHLVPQHLYKTAREEKRVHRYKKGIQKPLNEVHFYVQDISYPTMGEELSIPFGNITSVSVNNPNSGRSIANIFASTIGVLFALLLIVALTKSSCPFVYVKNGENYAFAGELYPGVITANMQRDDYLPLPSIDKNKGVFELKITNELKEIQHTDLAELILVEHAKNLKVLLDKHGNAHTFFNLENPKALSYDGVPQPLKQIASKDGDFWSFNSITDTPNGTREMILEFDNPKKSKTAKLFLTAKNSVWLDVVFGKFNEQFGTYYKEFQRQQQSVSKETSERWIQDQNIPLSISVETPKGWQRIDEIATVGPLAMRDLVIPMQVESLGEGPLRIKLETGFMFWDVDYVAIDYSPNVDVSVRHIKPSLATDENNYEVTHLLQQTDQQYLVQPEIGNEVDILFEIPPTSDLLTQSAFLKNRGYYNYIREYKGTPDFSLLKSFREKNAFTKFSEASYLNFASMDNLIVNYDNE